MLPASLAAIPPASEASVEKPPFEFRLEFTNDDLSGSTYPDDLYSFGGALGLAGKRYGLRLEERGFTDKIEEIRFDETYLVALRRFDRFEGARFPGWYGEVSFGVVRVGRGLIGESVQNEVHSWIGDELVEADYVTTNDLHPHLALAASGPVPGVSLGSSSVFSAMEAWVQIESSPGFRSTAAIGLSKNGPEVGLFRFEGSLGARWTGTQLGALGPWIEELAPTVILTTYFRQRYRLTWSYNAYGTGDLHWHFGFATPLRRRSAASAD